MLCEAYCRSNVSASIIGCPFLLNLWLYERLNIGHPQLRSYKEYDDAFYFHNEFNLHDAVDGPVMGSLWCKCDVGNTS